MGYDVNLVNNEKKQALLAEHGDEIHAYQQSVESSFSITYNYSKILYRVLGAELGLRSLYGLTGAQSVSVLENAISQLGDDEDEDRWVATEGNVKRALVNLLESAKENLELEWEGN